MFSIVTHIFNLFKISFKNTAVLMTTVPLIVSSIIAKVWCPVCVGSRADIFCLRLKELFFLFSFPPYFCLCEVLIDL